METKRDSKVGIVTIFKVENYGAVLQCYALKRYLETLFCQVNVVDYASESDRIGYNIFYNNLVYSKSYRSYIKYILQLPFLIVKKIRRKKTFKKFISRHIEPFSSVDENYDVVFYGSDQIFVYYNLFGGYDNVYWGDGIHSKRKIVYAASMGVISEADPGFIKKHILNFDSISVREDSLADYFLKNFNIIVQTVVDPTLLVDRNVWYDLCFRHRIFKRKYILVYNLNNNKTVYEIVGKISEEKNIPIVEIYGTTKRFESSYRKSSFSPSEFVTLIRDAEYVVTSSFHGVIFSVIFHKNFYVSQTQNSARVKDFLRRIDLNDHFVSDVNILDYGEIDYSGIDETLSKFVEPSKQFIAESLNLK